MSLRPILSIISIILLAGGIVLQFFIILSGAVNTLPMNHVYFLSASTSGFTGSNPIPNPARWTYFSICSAKNGLNTACGKVQAALPFDPRRNFDTTSNLPASLLDHSSYYYYMSRVSWAFYIIALFFAVIALLLSATALCSRLAAKLTGLTTLTAVVMQAIAAALMTAWTVSARDAFKSNGLNARLGEYAYAFTWTTFFCWLLSTALFCLGGRGEKADSSYQKSSYFGRKRSTRSRGSFRDSESSRRVKDEYE